MLKKIFFLVSASVIAMIFPAKALGIVGFVWTSAPSSAQVGDIITVSAKYYNKYGRAEDAYFCAADTPDGWTLDNGPHVQFLSAANGTATIKILSKGNGVFYVIAQADSAPTSDRIKITIGSTSSSPTLTLTSPVSEARPGTTVTLNCAAKGGSGSTTWSISSPVADTVENGVVQLSSVNTSRTVTVSASYSGLTKSVSLAVKAICDTPVIEPGDGTVFTTFGQKVVLSCATAGSTIRYTLDGSTPDFDSPVYTSPFNVTNDTTIIAFASASGFYDSPTTTATLTKYKETLLAPELFAKDIETDVMLERHQEVSIVAANNAAIYYTLDGSLPSIDSTLYEKPICVFTEAHIKAIAILDDWNDSTISSLVVTNPMSLSDAVNCTNLTMESSTWTFDTTQAFAGMVSLTSGVCADGTTNVLHCEIEGPKTISFRWKCSCEDDPDSDNWDYLCFLVNGEEKARIDGDAGWQEVSLGILTTGPCLLSWEFRKDAQLSAGEDCGWLDSLSISENNPVWPDVRDEAGVEAALAGAADGRLAERIGSVEEYEAFRKWIDENGLDAQIVNESAHTWPSYALGAKKLFENEPDIQISELVAERMAAKNAGSVVAMDVSVTVKDGENAVEVDAAKMAEMFEATRSLRDWKLAKLPTTVTQMGCNGATMQFKVVTDGGTVSEAFLRLALKSQQAITFAPIETQVTTDQVKLSATATGGGPVTFEVESGPGMIVGDTLSFTGPGTVVVRAMQPGDDIWLPAVATQMVVVADASEFLYMVVDLSDGPDADSWPVEYLDEEPEGGFNTDEYKTTKLVLRRIEAGTFMMSGEYKVTLTKPFFMGIFEVTQKQWELVAGSEPSAYKGDKRPVESVSYDVIRGSSSGANWPLSNAVDDSSFLGVLRAKTGLEFDLPTEAQWEYACRAGTTSSYNNGGSSTNDLNKLGRYEHNGEISDGHANVGSYLPNAWGLYDMHGNVWEWCLDRYGSLSAGTDPKGPSSGWGYRMLRGGSWSDSESSCSSSSRFYDIPSGAHVINGYDEGFRLVGPLLE